MQWKWDALEIPYSRWPFLCSVPWGRHTDAVLAYLFPSSLSMHLLLISLFCIDITVEHLVVIFERWFFSQNSLSLNTIQAVFALINSECVSFTALSCRNQCILVAQDIAACILRAGWNDDESRCWLPTSPRKWEARRGREWNKCCSIFPKVLGKANSES